MLNQSPIPKKKLKQTNWIDDKVKTVSINIKKSLQPFPTESIADKNQRDLNSIIENIKETVHREETTRSEKLQLLTILPKDWPVEKVCRELGVTKHLATKAKELAVSSGVFATPSEKLGKIFYVIFIK